MEIEIALKKLLIQKPFYGLFCLSLPKVITTKIPTLCVRKRGITCELCINPDFWNKHTDTEQIALLQHELGHICFQHMFLAKSFSSAELFNVAADMEVNSYIEGLPQGGCKAEDFGLESGKGTKYYYEELSNQQSQQAKSPDNPCNGGQGGEDGEDGEDGNGNSGYPNNTPNNVKPLDDHSTWKGFDNISEAVEQLIKNNINTMMVNAADQVDKQRGTIPGEFSEIISKLREKKPEIFNWKAYFRRILGTIYDINIKMTRRRESKRFEDSMGVNHKKKVSILVAVDTSGSVSKKELQDFFSEIEYIYKAGARITILECDTRINKIVEYDGKHIPEIVGRGGTSFDPPVDYYTEHRKDYASLIYFTDGECTLPKKSPSGMVWIITSNGYHQEYPGKTVYIPKDY